MTWPDGIAAAVGLTTTGAPPSPSTPAGRRTAMAARTRTRKTTPAAKKTTAKKAPAKKATPAAKPTPADRSTITDTRPPIAVRRRFVGPLGANEQAAVRAALASAALQLPIPVRAWNGSTARLADGTLLIHTAHHDRIFTAHIACPHGAIHDHAIRSREDLNEARAVTKICITPHGGINADQAITQGVDTKPAQAAPVLELSEGIRRDAKTEPLSLDEIAAGLAARAARAADNETPKEHPQP